MTEKVLAFPKNALISAIYFVFFFIIHNTHYTSIGSVLLQRARPFFYIDLFSFAYYKVIALPTIATAIVFALKGDSEEKR